MKKKLSFRMDESSYTEEKLDKKDKILLELLLEDCRMPITQIAKKLQLSKDSVTYRINKLQEKGIILGFYPEVDFSLLGYYEHHLFLLLDEMKPELKKEWIAKACVHPHVERIIEYTDRWDVEVVILAKNPKDYDRVEHDLLKGYQAMILEKEVNISINSSYKDIAPQLIKKKVSLAVGKEKKVKEDFIIDPLSIKILDALSDNARLSTYQLADAVGSSSDTVRLRIKKLVAHKVIKRFTTKLNLTALGFHQHNFIVDVGFITDTKSKKIQSHVLQHPTIIGYRKLLGTWEMRLELLTRTEQEYHEAVMQFKKLIAPIIRHYQSWMVYRELAFVSFPKCLVD